MTEDLSFFILELYTGSLAISKSLQVGPEQLSSEIPWGLWRETIFIV